MTLNICTSRAAEAGRSSVRHDQHPKRSKLKGALQRQSMSRQVAAQEFGNGGLRPGIAFHAVDPEGYGCLTVARVPTVLNRFASENLEA